jgi:hypothetical protein
MIVPGRASLGLGAGVELSDENAEGANAGKSVAVVRHTTANPQDTITSAYQRCRLERIWRDDAAFAVWAIGLVCVRSGLTGTTLFDVRGLLDEPDADCVSCAPSYGAVTTQLSIERK